MSGHVCDHPGCGFEAGSPAGLGAHRRYRHGVAGTSKATRSFHRNGRTNRSRLAAALGDMLPGATAALLGRLGDFVARHQPDRDLWLIATADHTPRLCRTGQIGLACRVDLGPAIVVQVGDIYDHLKETTA